MTKPFLAASDYHDSASGRVEILKRETVSFEGWEVSQEAVEKVAPLFKELIFNELARLLEDIFTSTSEEGDFPCIDLTLPHQFNNLEEDDTDGFSGPPVDYPLTLDVTLDLQSGGASFTRRYRLDEMLLAIGEDCTSNGSVYGRISEPAPVRRMQAELRKLADNLEPVLQRAENEERSK